MRQEFEICEPVGFGITKGKCNIFAFQKYFVPKINAVRRMCVELDITEISMGSCTGRIIVEGNEADIIKLASLVTKMNAVLEKKKRK